MGACSFKIAFYRIGNRCPMAEFIGSKNNAGKGKIDFLMGQLEEKGPELKRPYAAYLRDKIWELRPGINTEEYRLLYFWHGKSAVFLHAVDKKDFKQKDTDKAVLIMEKTINAVKKTEM